MQTNKSSIIIIAGGFGTRMKSEIPKVMHRICGKEMLFLIINEALKLSDDIIIVLYNKADEIKNALNKHYPNNNFTFHLQDYESFPGTAGAIMQGGLKNKANPKIPLQTKYDKIIILSGDMPLVRADKLSEFVESPCDIALGILELDNASGYGRVVLKDDKVEQIIEEKDATEEIKKINLANAGIYYFKKEVLEKYIPLIDSKNNQNEFYLTDIIHLAFKNKLNVRAVVAKESEFMGVNSKIDLAKAEEFMLDFLRKRAMKNGAILRISNSIYIEYDVEFEGECEIESNSVLKGKSKIINSKILAHSIIEDSTIINSSIGPFGRIRPKSVVKDTHIGNFVEVKASNLNGIKAGHLSYIGDSEIDSGTNIGAGVITCNYDGKTKHKTKIGKNVFVGSGSELVAPLEIESNVLIAAGSTITKNAKEGDLVISRSKQENKNGFFYTFFTKNK